MTRASPGRALPWLLGVPTIALLVALGVWQVERLAWKRALIAQVERRLSASPVPAPPPARWPAVTRSDAYTRVALHGRWVPKRDTYVAASTTFGSGYWVLTAFDAGGWSVLVNRGFIPSDLRGRAHPPSGDTVAGLLRVTEPGGGFLRANVPDDDRWYSRDVQAIARKRGLVRVAPYFIDADATAQRWPRGGLTIVRFPNNHLVYAITWFAMAALALFLLIRATRARDA